MTTTAPVPWSVNQTLLNEVIIDTVSFGLIDSQVAGNKLSMKRVGSFAVASAVYDTFLRGLVGGWLQGSTTMNNYEAVALVSESLIIGGALYWMSERKGFLKTALTVAAAKGVSDNVIGIEKQALGGNGPASGVYSWGSVGQQTGP